MTRFHTLNLFAMLAMTLLSAPTIYAAHVTNAAIDSKLLASTEFANYENYYPGIDTYTVPSNSIGRLKLTLQKFPTESGYKVKIGSSSPGLISSVELTHSSNAASHTFQEHSQSAT